VIRREAEKVAAIRLCTAVYLLEPDVAMAYAGFDAESTLFLHTNYILTSICGGVKPLILHEGTPGVVFHVPLHM
jgi:hypothetical protein